jgi:hypothetical protein
VTNDPEDADSAEEPIPTTRRCEYVFDPIDECWRTHRGTPCAHGDVE